MKKYVILIIFVVSFAFHNDLFSLARFTPKDAYIYVDWDIKNLDSIIRSISTKFVVNQRLFEMGYKKFKKEMIRNLDGLDVTSESSLRSIGLDLTRRSGFVLSNLNMLAPESSELFIGFAVSDATLFRNFLSKVINKRSGALSDRSESYKNYVLDIAQTKTVSGELADTFVTVVIEGYLLWSNNLNSIKSAIDAYKSGENLAQNPEYQEISKSLNKNNKIIFSIINGSFMDFLQNFMSQFSGKSVSSFEKGLYKLIGISINSNNKEFAIDTISTFNKNHPNYQDAINIYKPRSKKIDFFEYLPSEKPFGFMKLSFDSKLLFTKYIPKMSSENQEEFEKALEQIKKEFDFDIKTNVIDNLGDYYNVVLYNYDINAYKRSEEHFLASFDLLLYAEVINKQRLDKSLNFLIEKIKSAKPKWKSPSEPIENNSGDFKINQINIEGVKFYELTDKDVSIYVGSFSNYLLVASKLNRLKDFIRNVRGRKNNFISVFSNSELKKEFSNKSSSHIYIDFVTMVKNKAFPSIWSKVVNLNNLDYFHMNFKTEKNKVLSSMKLTFR